MNAYEHAVEEKYRFFSFGDAMFIKKEQINIYILLNLLYNLVVMLVWRNW